MKPFLKEKLLCKNNKYMLCYDKGIITIRFNKNGKIIQQKRIHSFIKSISLVERVLRYEPRVAVSLNENNFLYADHGVIYRYSVDENNIKKEHKFRKGMNHPLNFCTRYDDHGKLIDLLYGEYFWNQKKEPVSIYRRTNDKWKEVYCFPKNTITHIHNIIYDKNKNRYLIMTGDDDSDSAIWSTDINFKNVEPIVIGLQKYRACVMLILKDVIYYATDTPLEQNWLYKLVEKDNNVYTEKVYKMPGPCIYGVVNNNCLYMATSVEGDPTLGNWKYRFSNKLGKGVEDRFSHIIKCSENSVIEITKLKKDILPMWLFQFGNVKFPLADDNKVYICPQSTVCKHGTYLLED